MNKFAFLIHPRDTSDVLRRFKSAKFIPFGFIDKSMEMLYGRTGFTVCSKFKVDRGGEKAEGYIIAILLNGKQMVSLPIDKVRKRILDAVLYAQNNLGVNVVGLGSLTTSMTEGGRWIVNQPEVKITVTHGDNFTVAIAQEGIKKALNRFNLNPESSTIGVVGAFGLIGREICVFLVKKGYSLILIESVKEKIDLIHSRLEKEGLANKIVKESTDLEDLKNANFIVTATSHHSSLLESKYLKKNVVIYDIAQPMNVSESLLKKRPDIIKIDGDYVDISGINLGFRMGPPSGSTFACLTETAMIALEGEKQNHVGGIEYEFLNKTKEWGKKYDFHHAEFTCFGKPLKEIK